MKYILRKFLFKRTESEINEVTIAASDRKLAISKAFQIHERINKWIGNTNYEYISIGENCNTSWYLKETGNKQVSYPFDWIFSSPDIILDSIENQFNIFLNRKFYLSNKGKKSAGHVKYHSSLFNHRNPLNSEEDYQYYVRGAERFLKVLKDEDNILFVCTVINENDKRKGWYSGFDREFKAPTNQKYSDFDKLIASIQAQNSCSKFLFIEQYTETKFDLTYQEINDDVIWVKFSSFGPNNGVKYLNQFDDFIAKIIYSGMNPIISDTTAH